MNPTQSNQKNLTDHKTLKETCLAVCEKIGRQIRQARENVLAEFEDAFKTREPLLQRAVAEANALAWQTDYPHLLFPLLAVEKIQRAADWKTRQQFLLRNTSAYALAA
jgi:hypothetical protein